MQPTKIFVKPARPGMRLAHPVSGWLPDTGRRWIDDSFTRRRIADGGISIADPGDPEAKAETPAPVAVATVVAKAPIGPAPLTQTASEK